MKFGLSDDQLRQVQVILSKYPAIAEAVVFGSRAMGNYKEASDVDVALKGNVTLSMVADVKYELEEDTYLPFFFDVIAYGLIDAAKLKEHIDRYGETLYRAGWKGRKLSEVASLVKETCIPKPGDHLPYIGLEHIQEQGLRLLGVGDSDSVTSQKFCFKPNDVLFGKLRPYFRKVVKPDFAGVCSTDIWVVRAREENDQNFIFYFFANQEFVDTANSGDSGTRMPRADWNFLKDLCWQFPPLPEQRGIAAVLSSLDAKIDLLHRQNKTLESLASALWRKTFIEEARPNWKSGRVSDISSIITGKGLKRSEFVENGAYPVIGANGEIGRTNKFLCEDTVILTGRVGTLGKLVISEDKVWISDNVLIIKPTDNRYFHYVYFLLKEIEFENMNVGSTQPLVTQTDLKNIECGLPEDAIFTQYHITVAPLFSKQSENTRQIKVLSNMRDALLPKLMSGEVMVKS